MKKTSPAPVDDMRSEYDFASMKAGVRGKYVERARQGTNIVLIEPDVAGALQPAGRPRKARSKARKRARAARG